MSKNNINTEQTKGQTDLAFLKNVMNHEENALHKVLKATYICDAESGPYKTIQEAIDAAEPGSVIKVAPGLYSDNLTITKPGLRIEPKEKIGDIILVVSTKPAITIDLKKNEKCTILGLKISHSGNNEDVEKFERLMEDKEFSLTLFGGAGNSNALSNTNPENELINKFPIDPQMNCIILLNGGKLFIEDALLSLNFIVRSHKNIIPALVVNDGTEIIVNRCEIKGNKNHETIGAIIKKADALIKDSKIHNHLMGGVLIWGCANHNIKIMNSKILFNGKCGIHCVGEEGSPIIESNKIENNNGAGVKIGIANKARVVRNEIKLNQQGIEVISGDPFIFHNKIDKNYSDGILCKCHEELRSDGRIKSNDISGNKENGIHCSGYKNYCKIEQNSFIGYNKKAGVKADNGSQIVVYKNNICKNLAQGVLLVETSSGYIEKNNINENIKANIAFGGNNSVNTFIVDNKIYGGRCEGIFVIEGGEGWIIRNSIYENNDGIVCITSIPEISKNSITKNKSNGNSGFPKGIMILKDSRPKITNNQITDNDGIGLYIRDKSHGIIKSNVIKSNEIELVVEKKNVNLQNIHKENTVNGDIRIPQNFECRIF